MSLSNKIKSYIFEQEYKKANFIDEEINFLKDKIEDPEEIREKFISILENSDEDTKEKLFQYFDRNLPQSLRKLAIKEPQSMASIFFPVIGPIVSKFVSESMNDAIDKINDKIESQVPINKFTMFLKSKVFNIPKAELLLQDLSKHDVLGFFVIKKENGITLYKRTNKDFLEVNPNLFSSLLTAIQDFSKDCLSQEKSVDKIDYGNMQIEIENFGNAFLAIAVNGRSSLSFKRKIRSLYIEILKKYPDFHKNIAKEKFSEEIKFEFNNMFKKLSSTTHDVTARLLPLALCLVSIIMIAFYSQYKFNSRKIHKSYNQVFFSSHFPIKTQFQLNGNIELQTQFPVDSYKKILLEKLSALKLPITYRNKKLQDNKLNLHQLALKNIEIINIKDSSKLTLAIKPDAYYLQGNYTQKQKKEIFKLFQIDNIPLKIFK